MKKVLCAFAFVSLLFFSCPNPADSSGPENPNNPVDPNDPGTPGISWGTLMPDGTPKSGSFTVEMGEDAEAVSLYFTFEVINPGLYDIAYEPFTISYGEMDFSQDYVIFIYGNEAMTDLVDYPYGAGPSTGLELEKGQYYVKASAYYQLDSSWTFTLTRTGDLPWEGSELEPVALEPDEDHTARINSTKYSWYLFTLEEDALCSINLPGNETVNVDLTLYDDSGFTNQIYYSYSQVTGIADCELRAGTYYLKAQTRTKGEYELFMRVDTADFPAEGLETAPVPLTVDSIHSASVGKRFQSWYSVTVPAGIYTISISNLPENNDFALFLYTDAAYSQLLDSATWTKVGLGTRALPAGTYYIRGESDYIMDYDLLVEYVDAYPADGTKYSPLPLVLDTANSAKLGYIQGGYTSYYSLEVTNPGLYEIAATGMCNTTLRIYRDPGFATPLYTLDNNTAGLPSCDLTEGTWYFSIYNRSYDYEPCSFTLTPTRVSDFTFDGTETDPCVLTLGTSHAGKIGYSYNFGFDSYYRISLPDSGVYRTAVSNLNTGSLSITFYESSTFAGSSLNIYDTTTGDALALPHGGDWYIRATRKDGSIQDRTFDLLVTREGDYRAAGTTDAPIAIAVDEPVDAWLGYAYNQRSQYLILDVPEDGRYDIAATGLTTGLTFRLQDAALPNSTAMEAYNSTTGMMGYSLKAGNWKLWYYRSNTSTVPTADVTFTLEITRNGDFAGEGTAASPIDLTIGEVNSCRFGAHNKGGDVSVYRFTPTESGSYRFDCSITNSFSWRLWKPNGSYTTSLGSGLDFTFENTAYTLEAGVQYWLEMDSSDSSADRTFTLSLNREP